MYTQSPVQKARVAVPDSPDGLLWADNRHLDGEIVTLSARITWDGTWAWFVEEHPAALIPESWLQPSDVGTLPTQAYSVRAA